MHAYLDTSLTVATLILIALAQRRASRLDLAEARTVARIDAAENRIAELERAVAGLEGREQGRHEAAHAGD